MILMYKSNVLMEPIVMKTETVQTGHRASTAEKEPATVQVPDPVVAQPKPLVNTQDALMPVNNYTAMAAHGHVPLTAQANLVVMMTVVVVNAMLIHRVAL